MHDKMTGHRKQQKMKQKKESPAKGEDEKFEEVEKKKFENCIIFYANQYPEEMQLVIKTLLEIGYDDDFSPKSKPIDVFKTLFKDKKELGKAMKSAALLNDEVKESRSLDPLDLETPFHEKEMIEQHKDFIFGELDIENIEFKEKNEECDIEGSEISILEAEPGKPSIFFY